jgi:hypothetical protein
MPGGGTIGPGGLCVGLLRASDYDDDPSGLASVLALLFT